LENYTIEGDSPVGYFILFKMNIIYEYHEICILWEDRGTTL